MTAKDIQRRLMWDRYRASYVVPNYTPRGWFECDLFELTKAGYFREYEIKLTRSDFRADALKIRRENDEYRFKHHKLSVGSPEAPCQFWFVSPEGVLTPEIVPSWAGLITAKINPGRPRPFNVMLWESKKAPRLHRSRMSEDVKAHADQICYWRMHNLLLRSGHDDNEREGGVVRSLSPAADEATRSVV